MWAQALTRWALRFRCTTFLLLRRPTRIQITSVDGTHIPTGSNNLVYRSARVVYDQLGIPMKGLRITQKNTIPMARGLGSSSACIVAGILGANALLGNKLDPPSDVDAGYLD